MRVIRRNVAGILAVFALAASGLSLAAFEAAHWTAATTHSAPNATLIEAAATNSGPDATLIEA